MSESDFNKKVQETWTALGGYIIKTIVNNKAGGFDMFACMPDTEGLGRFCVLEGKVGTNTLSALQIAHRNNVIASGGLTKETKTLNDVLQLYDWVKSRRILTIKEDPKQLDSIQL